VGLVCIDSLTMVTALGGEVSERQNFQDDRALLEVIKDVSLTADSQSRIVDQGFEYSNRGLKSVKVRQPLTHDLLKELWFEQGKSIKRIAKELGYSNRDISSALHQHGISHDYHQPLADRLGAGELWHLHYEEALGVTPIARRFATGSHSVRRRMNELDIPVRRGWSKRIPKPERPAHVPLPNFKLLAELEAEVATRPGPRSQQQKPRGIDAVSAEEFRRLYHDEKLSLRDLAVRFHTGTEYVAQRAKDLGLTPLPRVKPGRLLSKSELVRRNELCEIARVQQALERLGIPGKGDSPQPVVDLTEAVLRELYEGCQLSIKEVALLCACSPPTIAKRLRNYEIEIRSKSKPYKRGDFDVEELRELSNKGMVAAQIADHFDVSTTAVLRVMHRHHLPVHRKGSIKTRIRFDELVADTRILQALHDSGVPLAQADPPARGPLPIDLLDWLINEVELRFFDIELLTGRPTHAVYSDALKAGLIS
jgi:hypothetical protein